MSRLVQCATAFAITGLAPLVAADGTRYFTDVTRQSGIDFVHHSGKRGDLYFPEMAGPGGALFDFDGDDDLDLFLVQGGPLGPAVSGAQAGEKGPIDRLYRNDTKAAADGETALRFSDVTEESAIAASGYGMGAAAGDVDGDGDIDLYVANVGPNQLWRNRGDGTFEDRTAASGTAGDAWSSGALFLDADHDGDLDLYVVDYVDFRFDRNITCYAPSSRRDYCGPQAYRPIADHLYRNRGDGTFEEATTQLLVGYHAGSGLGAAAFDADGDGDLDLFVANDGEPNQLWLRQDNGSFIDEALLAGVALNAAGKPEASMGVAVGDPDHDGDLDLFVTHLAAETNTFYENLGDGLFEDRSVQSGLGAPSLPMTGFGVGWLDVDADTWLDLAVVNGAVRIQEDLADSGRNPLEQSHQLYRSSGVPGAGSAPRQLTFSEVTERGGEAFTTASVGRGLLLGDLDNDGDTDLVILRNDGPSSVLESDLDPPRWLGVRLLDGQRDAYGAGVTIQLRGGPMIHRRAAPDGSYAASSDPRALTSLPAGAEVEHLTVAWPEHGNERFAPPPANRYTTLIRGTGLSGTEDRGSEERSPPPSGKRQPQTVEEEN